MVAGGDGVSGTEGRRRDAEQSRAALLEAAQVLFSERGYEATTLRAVAERAGLDAALVARYFGSKANLYAATVVAERHLIASAPEATRSLEELLRLAIARFDAEGIGPNLQILLRSDSDPELAVTARANLRARLLEPLAGPGADAEERLSAAIAIAALLGIAVGRSLRWFDELALADADEVLRAGLERLGLR